MTFHNISTTLSEKCGLLHCYADLLRTPQIKKVRMRTFAAKNGPIWEPCIPNFGPLGPLLHVEKFVVVVVVGVGGWVCKAILVIILDP